MAQTINFCGDSFCASIEPSAWTYQLAKLLKCDILGSGNYGAAHEHAIQSFNEEADVTVFCWTEPDRIYHPDVQLNFGTANAFKKTNKIYAAAHAYYKYVHDFEHSKTKQMRELYWFDHEVLSKYSGKIVHCWCFLQTYDFVHGITFDKILFNLNRTEIGVNHLSDEQNYKLAHELYNLIRR